MRSSALASGFARASSGFAKASETAFAVGLSTLADGASDVAAELSAVSAGLADGLSSVAAVPPHAERSIAPTRTTRTLERRFGIARG
jgi:hypothetical protein